VRGQHRLLGGHSLSGQFRQHLREIPTRRLPHHPVMIRLDI
jgi:hypothetical protein